MMSNCVLSRVQAEVAEWAKQFGDNESKWDRFVESTGLPTKLFSMPPFLGMVEEMGELAAPMVKRIQGRGFKTEAEYKPAVKDALADMLIFMCDYANREGVNLAETLEEVWDTVQKRRQQSWVEDKDKERQILEKSDKTLKYKESYSCSNGEITVEKITVPRVEGPPIEFTECNEAGFIEPPEKDCFDYSQPFVEVPRQPDITYNDGSIIFKGEPAKIVAGSVVSYSEFPKKPDGTPDNQGWSFGMPTEPGDYEWFSPVHSLDPSKITIYENYSGILRDWGRAVYYRKLPAKVEWKFGTPTEDGDYAYYYPRHPESIHIIRNWTVNEIWGAETYYRKITGSFLEENRV